MHNGDPNFIFLPLERLKNGYIQKSKLIIIRAQVTVPRYVAFKVHFVSGSHTSNGRPKFESELQSSEKIFYHVYFTHLGLANTHTGIQCRL